MEWTVTPETDPTPDGYFWSHQVAIIGGEAAYAGLQTLGSEPTGKIAIFSVWNAVGAEGPVYAAPFGGEGEGWSVRIPFPWSIGTRYAFRIAHVRDDNRDSDDNGTWEARVDGVEIGRIFVPRHWRGLAGTSVMWTERYTGSLQRCADIRHAMATFGTPFGTPSGTPAADSRAVHPTAHRNHLGEPPGCPGSSVVDVDGGVRHEMGGTR
jgi:hypothetical protein